MKVARLRLIVAGLLLVGWFGYLGYLAIAMPPATAVSRSQLLTTTHVVKASLTPKPHVETGKMGVVLENAQIVVGEPLPTNFSVENVDDARLSGGKQVPTGDYLLPLQRTGPTRFRIVTAPGANRLPLVYPATADDERQIRDHLQP